VDLIRYVVKAVVLEGLSVREVAAAHGVSRSWVYECLARYRAEGIWACSRGRAGRILRRPGWLPRWKTRSWRCGRTWPGMAVTTRLELATPGVTSRCSDQLS
jgi:Winged helix-turn helix